MYNLGNRGIPPKDKKRMEILQVCLKPDDLEEVKKKARSLRLSSSAYVRTLIFTSINEPVLTLDNLPNKNRQDKDDVIPEPTNRKPALIE